MARTIASELRKHGFDAWLDEHELRSGQSWTEALRKQLDTTDTVVVLISENSQGSQWARMESTEIVKRAWTDDSKVVLPLIVGSAEPPGYLRDLAPVRVDPADPVSAAHALLVSLRARTVPGGIGRSEAGERRLAQRLAELQRTAASLAAKDEDE